MKYFNVKGDNLWNTWYLVRLFLKSSITTSYTPALGTKQILYLILSERSTVYSNKTAFES